MAGAIAGAVLMAVVAGLLAWRAVWTWTSDQGRAQERARKALAAERKQRRKETWISGGTVFGMETPSERRHREMLAAIQQKELKP